jgi:hypothetical protein
MSRPIRLNYPKYGSHTTKHMVLPDEISGQVELVGLLNLRLGLEVVIKRLFISQFNKLCGQSLLFSKGWSIAITNYIKLFSGKDVAFSELI